MATKREIAAIGKLDKRIRIEYQQLTPDGQGGQTAEWMPFTPNDFSDKIWAKVEPINSYERLFSQKLEYQRSHKIVIRFLKGLETEMRIVYDDKDYGERIFQIKAFRNVNEQRFYIEIDAQANVGA